jgi:crotonobetainyl-CoA:carnitine CoA-transferase CaiB-like acyl-CoA transferase
VQRRLLLVRLAGHRVDGVARAVVGAQRVVADRCRAGVDHGAVVRVELAAVADDFDRRLPEVVVGLGIMQTRRRPRIDRVQRRSELAEELQPTFLTRPAEEWVELFLAAGVPAGPINDYSVALDNEHVRHRAAVIDIEHPVEGSFKALGFPAKLSETPARLRRPPPLLGEHTAEILAELGLHDTRSGGAVTA